MSKRLKEALPLIFVPSQSIEELDKRASIEKIVSQRMEGGTSIERISTIMKREGLKYSSVGFISQSLSTIGSLLPNVQEVTEELEITVLMDEIFIGSRPILISMEPKSSVILNIELAEDRSAKTWSKHIEELKSQKRVKIIRAVSDEGRGILKGIKDSLPAIHRQPDTFHTLSHRLGVYVHQFEEKAYSTIAKEYDKERVCLNRQTDKKFEEKQEEYNRACLKSEEAIACYENFSYLYRYAIEQLPPILPNGEIRDATKAKEEIETALELMALLNHQKIDQELKRIGKILPNLLGYLQQTKCAIDRCKALGLDNDTITAFSLAWQWDKALIKAKRTSRRAKAREERDFYMEYLKESLGKKFHYYQELLFDELDNIVQASSMVENINSLLRPYLNSFKNQVTQSFLNLFAFYHNHRRYISGKRKGKTPMEILTKQKGQEDWLTLLMKFIDLEGSELF